MVAARPAVVRAHRPNQLRVPSPPPSPLCRCLISVFFRSRPRYRGRVSEYSKYTAKHTVAYDDGETKQHRLDAFPLRIMSVVPRDEAEAYAAARGGGRRPPLPAAAPLLRDPWKATATAAAGDGAAAAAADAAAAALLAEKEKEVYDVGDVVRAVALAAGPDAGSDAGTDAGTDAESAVSGRAGVIAKARDASGVYGVAFDDGSQGRAAVVRAALEAFPPGATLKAKRTPGSRYYAPASVVRRNSDGRYLVEFGGYPRTSAVIAPTMILRRAASAPQGLTGIETWAERAAAIETFVTPPLKLRVTAAKLRTRYSKPTGSEKLAASSEHLVPCAPRAALVPGAAASALWNPLDCRLFPVVVLPDPAPGADSAARSGADSVRVRYALGGEEKTVPRSWVCAAECASTDVRSHRPVGGPAAPRTPRAPLAVGDDALLWIGARSPTAAQQWRPCVVEEVLGGGASSAPEGIVADARANAVLRLWKGDITRLAVDAIQNAANSALAAGGGICGAIHAAAGAALQAACYSVAEEVSKRKGGDGVAGSSWGATRCREGDTKITPGFDLPATWVLHSVGPTGAKPAVLRSAYRSALDAAVTRGCKSVALCAISTGIFGYKIDAATPVALGAIREWLDEGANASSLDAIVLCLWQEADVRVYEQWMPIFFPVL